jgi:acetyltransferase-like isoleucine patch superfamily enzyme
MSNDRWISRASLRKGGRIIWTIASALVVEGVVLGVSAVPAVLLWQAVFRWTVSPNALRLVVLTVALVPAYVVFALGLTVWSALAMRVVRWRTPADAEMRIADLDWPLLCWARYLVSAHVVRSLAGDLFRATPVWTFYHRLNGARMGRRVYINSLTVVDDNLLDFGEGVVIGSGVHLSGHTVEGGVVKTGPVRLGPNVTIGVGSVVGIGVEIGPNTEVGALSVVPKHRRLEAGAVYGGVPVRRLDGSSAHGNAMTHETTIGGGPVSP